jgi:hypothetical protein
MASSCPGWLWQSHPMRGFPFKQFVLDSVGITFEHPIVKWLGPLDHCLQTVALDADTGAIFRRCLY